MMLKPNSYLMIFALCIFFAGIIGLKEVAIAGAYEDAIKQANSIHDVKKAYDDYSAKYNKAYGKSAGLTPGSKSDKAIADQKKAADDAYSAYKDVKRKRDDMVKDIKKSFGK